MITSIAIRAHTVHETFMSTPLTPLWISAPIHQSCRKLTTATVDLTHQDPTTSHKTGTCIHPLDPSTIHEEIRTPVSDPLTNASFATSRNILMESVASIRTRNLELSIVKDVEDYTPLLVLLVSEEIAIHSRTTTTPKDRTFRFMPFKMQLHQHQHLSRNRQDRDQISLARIGTPNHTSNNNQTGVTILTTPPTASNTATTATVDPLTKIEDTTT